MVQIDSVALDKLITTYRPAVENHIYGVGNRCGVEENACGRRYNPELATAQIGCNIVGKARAETYNRVAVVNRKRPLRNIYFGAKFHLRIIIS